jgi:hypothetical protein
MKKTASLISNQYLVLENMNSIHQLCSSVSYNKHILEFLRDKEK